MNNSKLREVLEKIVRVESGRYDPKVSVRYCGSIIEDLVEHVEELKIAMQGDRTPGEIGFANYAALVAEVYAIEGEQIKPNDPRLHLPDNRCRACLATMKEPQVLTPVRRQVHKKLQTGWHLPECPYKNRK